MAVDRRREAFSPSGSKSTRAEFVVEARRGTLSKSVIACITTIMGTIAPILRVSGRC